MEKCFHLAVAGQLVVLVFWIVSGGGNPSLFLLISGAIRVLRADLVPGRQNL